VNSSPVSAPERGNRHVIGAVEGHTPGYGGAGSAVRKTGRSINAPTTPKRNARRIGE